MDTSLSDIIRRTQSLLCNDANAWSVNINFAKKVNKQVHLKNLKFSTRYCMYLLSSLLQLKTFNFLNVLVGM